MANCCVNLGKLVSFCLLDYFSYFLFLESGSHCHNIPNWLSTPALIVECWVHRHVPLCPALNFFICKVGISFKVPRRSKYVKNAIGAWCTVLHKHSIYNAQKSPSCSTWGLLIHAK